MRTQIVLIFLWVVLSVQAQSGRQWEQYLNDVMTTEDMGSDTWEETYHLLCELEQHPINLNLATREQLEQFPFLSAQQVEEIVAYNDQYGPMKSLAELQMIQSLDYTHRRLLNCFVEIPEEEQQTSFPSVAMIANHGHSELVCTGRIPFYQRKGDIDGYLGYPYRHWLKYQLTYGDYVKAGIVGSQDAGEPFFGDRNRLGYDFYSLYLQVRRWQRLESMVIGQYRISMGMGLVINNNFGLGKVSMLQNLGRTATTLRAHSSRSSADYLQGAAATVRLAKGLTSTGFVSYRAMDATLNKDGTAATIVTSGYHRTETEMKKKDNLKNLTFGGQIAYNRNGLHLGMKFIGTHLDRELKPNTSLLYRQHALRGHDFWNASVDYGFVSHCFSLNGETAIRQNGALATINSLSMQLNGELSLMALYRFYSYRYASLYARSFSDGGEVQNESGAYLGLSWQLSPRWRMVVYADYAYFPWARYQVSQSSNAWDFMAQLSYQSNHWKMGSRYRWRIHQKDSEAKTVLISKTDHQIRLSVDYNNGITSHSQLDVNFTSFKQHERGIMFSESVGYAFNWLKVSGGMGYFDTDSYNSRVYLYEQGPLYTYGFTQFNGRGTRYWLMVRATIGRSLTLTAKVGCSAYLDRDHIGSGYQLINGSTQTDLDVQLRLRI